MRSIADELRAETRAKLARLGPVERLRLAFALGDTDVALLSAARRIDPVEARRVIARSRRVGRQPSRCAESGPR
jgi:hypothetical protein